MTKILLFSVLLSVQPMPIAAGESPIELAGYISSWVQDCSGRSCSLPKPVERNRPVTLRLAAPSVPGEASAVSAFEALVFPEGEKLSAELAFFAVCPYAGRGNCAGRYFQAQVSLSGAAGAFCAAAFNADDFTPFPVLLCAGAAPGGRRFGITLHRQKL